MRFYKITLKPRTKSKSYVARLTVKENFDIINVIEHHCADWSEVGPALKQLIEHITTDRIEKEIGA